MKTGCESAVRRLAFIMTVLLTALPAAAGPSENGDAGAKRFYFEGGLLFGSERETRDFDDSPYRLLLEAGFESSLRPIESIGALERVGLSYDLIFGKSDIRHSLGPTLKWRLNERWSLRNMAGVALSSGSEIFGPGLHAGNALIYNEIISVCLVYQVLPVKTRFRDVNGERVESVYGGVTIHGKAGAAVTLTIAGAILVLGLLYASSGAGFGS